MGENDKSLNYHIGYKLVILDNQHFLNKLNEKEIILG